MADTSRASRLILVAGVPRSGSTWAFNAARCLLEAAGTALHAAWVADYNPADPAPTHLVKAHQVAEVTFTPDLILTTKRAPEACIASLIRMGWLAHDPDAIRKSHAHHLRLYAHWAARSDLEVTYEEILETPAAALARLATLLETGTGAADHARIAADLATLKAPPAGRYDPRTLLHPAHRRQRGDSGPDADEIRRILAG